MKKTEGLPAVLAAARPRFISLAKNSPAKLDYGAEIIHLKELLRKSETLQECTEESIKHCFLQVATLGLSMNPSLAYVYLIPYKVFEKNERGGKKLVRTEAQVTIGYRGLIHAMLRSGVVLRVESDVVHEKDSFRLVKGSNPLVEFSRALGNRGKQLGAFAAFTMKVGGTVGEFMDMDELKRVQDAAMRKAGGEIPSSYKYWPGEMQKKSVIRRLTKLINVSDPNLVAVMTHMDSTEGEFVDGAAVELIDEKQLEQLNASIKHEKVLSLVLEAYGIHTLDEMPKSKFDEALKRVVSFQGRLKQ